MTNGHIFKKALSALAAFALIAGCASPEKGPRTVEDFNFGWRFTLGDNEAWSGADFDDASWRQLHLPHDWAVEGEFSEENHSGANGGALPGGVGWYRKHFPTPAGDKVFIEFDGVFMLSTVYVNGKIVGTRPYGYSSFSYDITGFLNPEGVDNVIAVRCDNAEQPNSRWYSGCGIYRNVRLVSVDDVHVAYCGTYVTTPEIHDDAASFCIQTTVEKSSAGQGACVIKHVVKDPDGKVAGSVSDEMPLACGENVNVCSLAVGQPRLWSVDEPSLYTVETTVSVDGEVVDNYTTTTGIRYMDWDADKGFFLNGKPMKLLGVCLHHDMGCIGSAVHMRALERELQMMKDMGVNAIRTSHNPPAPELLQIADRLGFVVIDEAFDTWRHHKTPYDYAKYFEDWHVADMEGYVKRDRNHPCIIMWSIANEIHEQGWGESSSLAGFSEEEVNLLINFMEESEKASPEKVNGNILLARHMVKIIKDLDPTRYVTAGCNSVSSGNNLFNCGSLDALGINYHPHLYDSMRVWYPGKLMYGSETASSLNSRGWYPQPPVKAKAASTSYVSPDGSFQCPSYDVMSAPWAQYHEDAWKPVRDRDFIAGTFLWTGFDYLGEPTPFYRLPARSSYFGIVDLAGFPKDPYWFYQSEWTDKTVLHLFPHWNWKEGDKVDIWCYYSNADEVELFVNGVSHGTKSKTKDVLHAEWPAVAFEPGKIEVVSYKDGKEVARDVRCTTGEPASIRLTADRTKISADGYDLSYVTVEALDANGLAVPDADVKLHFSVEGAGELFGIDNGKADDLSCLKGNDKAMFSGKALAVIRSIKGERGKATLTVTSDLGTAKINITTK